MPPNLPESKPATSAAARLSAHTSLRYLPWSTTLKSQMDVLGFTGYPTGGENLS